MDTCETVKIKFDNEQGFIIINKSDLKKEHSLFEKQKPGPKPKKKAE